MSTPKKTPNTPREDDVPAEMKNVFTPSLEAVTRIADLEDELLQAQARILELEGVRDGLNDYAEGLEAERPVTPADLPTLRLLSREIDNSIRTRADISRAQAEQLRSLLSRLVEFVSA